MVVWLLCFRLFNGCLLAGCWSPNQEVFLSRFTYVIYFVCFCLLILKCKFQEGHGCSCSLLCLQFQIFIKWTGGHFTSCETVPSPHSVLAILNHSQFCSGLLSLVPGTWHVLLPSLENFPLCSIGLTPSSCSGLSWEAFSNPQTWQRHLFYVPLGHQEALTVGIVVIYWSNRPGFI